MNGRAISSTPWRNAQIKDDPVKQSNKRGFVTFDALNAVLPSSSVFLTWRWRKVLTFRTRSR